MGSLGTVAILIGYLPSAIQLGFKLRESGFVEAKVRLVNKAKERNLLKWPAEEGGRRHTA